MHAVETMAYAAAVPWHGLGNKVSNNMTPDELRIAAGLDWPVQRRKLFMRAERGSDAMIEVPDFLAITRGSDNRVFAVKTDAYHPYQNHEVLDFFRQWTEAGDMHLEVAGALKGGAVVWALASIDKSFVLPGGDEAKGYLLLANSHDGTMSFVATFTGVYVVCWNTLMAALSASGGAGFRMRHTRKWTSEVRAEARAALGLAVDAMHRQEDSVGFLAENRIEDGQVLLEYVARLVQPDLLGAVTESTERQERAAVGAVNLDDIVAETGAARRKLTAEDFRLPGRMVLKSILESPGAELESRKGTWWGAVSGVTHYVDHVAGRTNDNRLTSAWFGPRAALKAEAVELATKYAMAAKA